MTKGNLSAMLSISIAMLPPSLAHAINPPDWRTFEGGVSVDLANIKRDGDEVSAYVRVTSAHARPAQYLDMACKDDRLGVHSDAPRYVSVPVPGTSRVVIQSADGKHRVIPGTVDAQIEAAVCDAAPKLKNCEDATRTNWGRVDFMAHNDMLSYDAWQCLDSLLRRDVTSYVLSDVNEHCPKAGAPLGIVIPTRVTSSDFPNLANAIAERLKSSEYRLWCEKEPKSN